MSNLHAKTVTLQAMACGLTLWIGSLTPLFAETIGASAVSPSAQSTDTQQGQPSAQRVYSAEPLVKSTSAAATLTPPVIDLEPIELKASIQKTENYPVTLATVLQLISDQNLLIAQNRKNTEVLQSRYRQSQAALLPSIEGVYTQSRLSGGQQIFGGDVITVIRNTTQPQLTASWTLYPGGKNIYEMLAAKRRKKASDSLLNGTVQEQLSGAAQDYYKLLAAYMQKGVIVRSINQAREQVILNQAKVKVGKGVPLDLSRARTNYAQQQSALVQAESAIIQAEQALLNRLNLDADIHLVPDALESRQRELISDEVPFKSLLTDAIKSHPSLTTIDQELSALGMDYRATRSDLIPSVTVRTYVNGTGPDRQNLTRTTYGGLTVNMNLLQNMGLQVPLRMQERKKLIEQKKLERQSLVRNLESQIMTAYLNGKNYKAAIEAAEQEVASAQESYDLAMGRYKAGYGLNVDVLEADTALATARNNLVQAVLNFNQSQVQLVQALGHATPEHLLKGLDKEGIAANGK